MKSLAWQLLVALVVVVLAVGHRALEIAQNNNNLVDYVNILSGTDSRYDMSHGGTLPFICRPWGFNHYAPQSTTDGGWWFHPYDRQYYGIRVTHQPSPWIQDYGNFLIKASIPQSNTFGESNTFTGYSPKTTVFSPYYFQTNLLAYGTETDVTNLEFVPSRHGGVVRIHYPSFVHSASDSGFLQTRRVSITLNNKPSDTSSVSTMTVSGQPTLVMSGKSTANSGGVSSNFAHYFVAALYTGDNGDKPILSSIGTHADGQWAYVDLSHEYTQVTLRFATSFISTEQALLNLEREVSATDKTFDGLKAEAKNEWNDLLSRVHVADLGGSATTPEAATDVMTTFYSSLYRASLFPRQLDEVDANGKTVHWSPYDGTVHDGTLTTDSGFWDAYSTVYPLQSLINRPRVGEMVNGWLNAYKEGGWLPKWASPGYRGSMVGTMGDVSLADAIVKNIPNFDRELAYEAIRKDAFEVPPEGVEGVGRVCLSSYLQYGYIPRGAPMTTGGTCTEIVSRSLNYMHSDFAIAQAALSLGKTSDAAELMSRAGNFSSIFDATTGFFRSRDIVDRKFTEPFDQYAWGGDYTEGGPWQFRFYVPYDPLALAKTYAASNRDMCNELQGMQTTKSTFHLGGYHEEIHEQTELPDNCWGQYAHGNQPVHHVLYQFGAIDSKGYLGGCAAKGQYWLRKTMAELYKPGADTFPGDEDNGEMSSWYILSSLGLYSLSPGSPDLVFGSPQFGKVIVQLDGSTGKQLVVVAENNSKENVYVQQIFWNDVLLQNTNSIAYEKLMAGGVLRFKMGPNPASA